jgi:hypothetical protein
MLGWQWLQGLQGVPRLVQPIFRSCRLPLSGLSTLMLALEALSQQVVAQQQPMAHQSVQQKLMALDQLQAGVTLTGQATPLPEARSAQPRQA